MHLGLIRCGIVALIFAPLTHAQIHFDWGYAINDDLAHTFKRVSQKQVVVSQKSAEELRMEGCIEIGTVGLITVTRLFGMSKGAAPSAIANKNAYVGSGPTNRTWSAITLVLQVPAE